MIIQLYFFTTLIGLLIATYTDLKERMVYNKLTFTLIGLGIGLKIIEAIKAESIEPILIAVIGGVIAFTASYLMWHLGIWAGGDVKLVTAIAIINPINYAFLAPFIGLAGWPFTTLNLPIFSISIILYSALAVFPLGIMMSFTALVKHPKVLGKTVHLMKEKIKQLIGLSVILAGLNIILEMFAITSFATIVILAIIAFFPKKIRITLIGIIGLAGLLLNAQGFFVNAVLVFIPLSIGYFIWKLYNESKEYAFKETIKIEKLEEGMIPDKYVVEKNNRIELVEGPSIKRVIKNLMNNKIETSLEDFKVKGKVIGSPAQAGGFTEKEVQRLKEKAKKGFGPKEIVVRKTMAFVPAILIAYLVLQLSGDVIWNLILM
ncbi:MAG: A24 family peptidase [archaeon]|nr:A24 family peptidase [archaeon]